jgi:hypothetical protein
VTQIFILLSQPNHKKHTNPRGGAIRRHPGPGVTLTKNYFGVPWPKREGRKISRTLVSVTGVNKRERHVRRKWLEVWQWNGNIAGKECSQDGIYFNSALLCSTHSSKCFVKLNSLLSSALCFIIAFPYLFLHTTRKLISLNACPKTSVLSTISTKY